MSSIFQVTKPFCIFAPSGCTETTFQNIAFSRAMVSQTSAGDTVLSFSFFATIAGDLQPLGGTVLRQIQGQVVEISHRLFLEGATALREKDRCTVDGYQMEIVNVSRYGGESAEVDLRQMGR
jgi:hypothetical protein